MSWYVYILRCAGDTLYTGITADLPRRLRQHLGQIPGGAKYTAAHRPERVEMVWEAPDHPTAARLEWQVKQLPRPKKERLLREYAQLPAVPRPDLTGDVENIAENRP